MNGNANVNGTHEPAFHPGEFSIDEYRPMKVICIGAGYAGIIAGIRFRQRIPNLELEIYEKENGIGGTWLVNKYPGLACDIPSHIYQLSFETNTQWSRFYAPGSEIHAYLEHVVEKYKLRKYIHLQHELTHARFDEATAKWVVRIRRHVSNDEVDEFEDTADVLFLGVGGLNRWHWPKLDGLDNFGGTLVHSAQWNLSRDTTLSSSSSWREDIKSWSDKNVGVIGNGSTGIQIVPALQPSVKTLTNFIRSKTWLSSSFSSAKMLDLVGRKPGSIDYTYDSEFREKLKDPEYYAKFRRALETDVNSIATIVYRDSPLQKAVSIAFKQEMRTKLSRKPELIDKLIPEFSVGCRRLTPGPGYLEALCEDNVTLETSPIQSVTSTGAVLSDGRHVPLDVLICATGFDTSFHYPFPVLGRAGVPLNERWQPHAEAYLTLAVDGFPNLWLGFGPNSAPTSGSFVIILEKQVDFVVAAVAKMQRERHRSMEVKKDAVHDFNEVTQRHFVKTVHTDDCRSWYRNEAGTIVGLWPGSSLHILRALSHPRWEDFNYEPFDAKTKNRFYWLGDGLTFNEKTLTGDRSWYLNNIDVPPIPED